ncbi:MAG: hypothetical protein HZB39_14715 [Planctomycetes bacterium]|nr:hypothetical protein [Planctomycetota bacterium]
MERHPGVIGWLAEVIAGEEEAHFVSPGGLARSGDVLWITDPGGACVHRLSLATGEHRIVLGLAEQPFLTPVGVAVAPDGRAFVTDAARAVITMLDASGRALRCFGVPGIAMRPTGICFDEHRARLLVLDTVGCKLHVFDPEGNWLRAAGERGTEIGQFNYPTNLALASDGRVLIVDSLNFRIQVLSPELEPVGAFGRVGRGPGDFSNPKGIAVDSRDNIYVVDSMFDNVQIFDGEGRLLLAVATTGQDLGQLYLPTGIHIDGFDRLYVSDSGNSRIQVMRLEDIAR